MKKRIWELDALRGICILGVIAVHFIFDMVELYGLVSWSYPPLFSFIKDWGGMAFLLLSGICVTLGSRCIRRGLFVFGFGLVVTLTTVLMYLSGLFHYSIIIYFGALHCLGICMMLWPLFRKLPWQALLLIGAVMIALGFGLRSLPQVNHPWLMIFGLPWRGFISSDYFPLLPSFGFFLVGAAVGKTAYRNKESLLPKVNPRNIFIRFLCFCGRQSLWLYLLHQPLLGGIFYLIFLMNP